MNYNLGELEKLFEKIQDVIKYIEIISLSEKRFTLYLANGEKIKIEGEGLLAQAIAHEIDHLEGILFIDKVIPGTLEYSTPEEQK